MEIKYKDKNIELYFKDKFYASFDTYELIKIMEFIKEIRKTK